MNDGPGFFPLEVIEPAGTTIHLLNREHVLFVTLGERRANCEQAPDADVAIRRPVRLILDNGARLDGYVPVSRPRGRDRLSDHTRWSEAVLVSRRAANDRDRQRQPRDRTSGAQRDMTEGAARPVSGDRCALFQGMTEVRRLGPAPLRRVAAAHPQGRPHAAARSCGGAADRRGSWRRCSTRSRRRANRQEFAEIARHRLRLRDPGAGALPRQPVRRSQRSRRGVPRDPDQAAHRRAARAVASDPRTSAT